MKATVYRFPTTEVPAEATSYFCQYFPLDNIPEGTSEHVIGYEPVIDNAEIMHHTVVYGCKAEQGRYPKQF